jgi:hypothetical protein
MDVATQGAPNGAAPPTVDSIASLFEAELKAESAPPKPEKAAPEPVETEEQPDTETEPAETGEESDQPDTAEEAETADETDSEGEPGEAPASQTIDAPSGMSEADKAAFAKLSPELKGWVSKRMADQQADYTRKSQEVATQRKTYEAAVPQLMGKLQQYDQILARFTDPDLTPPNPELRHTDPGAWEEQTAQYNYRKDLQEKAKAERNRVSEEFQQHQATEMRRFYAEQAEELRKIAPELGADTPKAVEMRKAVHKYGVEQGYTPEMLKQASARDIATLWKAQRFDAAEKAKANVKVVQKAPPKIAAPGPAKGGRPSNFARAVQDLSKNPSVDALEAAFLAELQSEKR